MKTLIIAAMGLAVLPCAWPAALTFEVASIKPAPAPTGKGLSVRVSQDKGRITMTNVSLRDVLTRAFKVKVQQLNTPDWMESTRFDITAKLPEGANKDQVPEMLQALLMDRFQLTTHKESKVMPVYALIVAKSGPKLKEFEGEGGLNTGGSAKGRTMTGKINMSTLADSLSGMLDRPVVDMTAGRGSSGSWRFQGERNVGRAHHLHGSAGKDGTQTGGEKGADGHHRGRSCRKST
jgi:uncharacterized protein (TIGR03435 family)